MIVWLSAVRGVDKADMKAIVNESVSRHQPGKIVSEYNRVACHMDGATWRVNKDRIHMPAAMLSR